jgi:hypothetical protein
MKNDKNKADDTIKTQSIGRPKKELDEEVIAKIISNWLYSRRNWFCCWNISKNTTKTICRFSNRKQKQRKS